MRKTNRNSDLGNVHSQPFYFQDIYASSVGLDLKNIAVLLDVDGTLLDIAPTPESVQIPPSLNRTLLRLRARTNGAVAFVSGRTLAQLDRLFAPLELFAIGGHGAELRVYCRDGRKERRAAPLNNHLRARLANILKVTPSLLMEDKGYAIALHFRLAPNLERMLQKEIAIICAECAPTGTEILHGKTVFEIKSAHFNKGNALRELMSYAPFYGRRPIFIGDDETDNDVFAVLPEFSGIGFSVGHLAKGAIGFFERPRDVRLWLGQLSEENGASS